MQVVRIGKYVEFDEVPNVACNIDDYGWEWLSNKAITKPNWTVTDLMCIKALFTGDSDAAWECLRCEGIDTDQPFEDAYAAYLKTLQG